MKLRDFFKLTLASPAAILAAESLDIEVDPPAKVQLASQSPVGTLFTPEEISRHWVYVPKPVVKLAQEQYCCVSRIVRVAIPPSLFNVEKSEWTCGSEARKLVKHLLVQEINKLGISHVHFVRARYVTVNGTSDGAMYVRPFVRGFTPNSYRAATERKGCLHAMDITKQDTVDVNCVYDLDALRVKTPQPEHVTTTWTQIPVAAQKFYEDDRSDNEILFGTFTK